MHSIKTSSLYSIGQHNSQRYRNPKNQVLFQVSDHSWYEVNSSLRNHFQQQHFAFFPPQTSSVAGDHVDSSCRCLYMDHPAHIDQEYLQFLQVFTVLLAFHLEIKSGPARKQLQRRHKDPSFLGSPTTIAIRNRLVIFGKTQVHQDMQ